MDTTGAGYAEALDEATALGYAEADPTADVEGFDAAAKAAILAGIAFHTRVRLDDVYREGLTEVTAADIASAKRMGCTVKLLAICERAADGRSVTARVHPAMIPLSHPLASVREAYNAVFVESDAAGPADVLRARRGRRAHRLRGARRPRRRLPQQAQRRHAGPASPRTPSCPSSPMGEVVTRYHISLDVADKPGVLAQVATVFAEHGVSIDTVRQQGKDGEASLVVVTHRAPDAALSGDRRGAAQARHRARCRQHHAGRRGVRTHDANAPTSGAESSRSTATGCPRLRQTTVVTLREGGTPLVPAQVLSERTGCEVHLKVEGANPTGSFKDRGMTMAITRAKEEGAQAVICASTGNTSASAAAYAVRAGMVCAVLVPQGKIALGKMGQALVHGAKILQVDGQLRRLPHPRPRPVRQLPGGAGQFGQPRTVSRARRPRRSRSSTCSATHPTSMSCRSATRATSRRTGRATREYAGRRRAVRARTPRCGASRHPAAAPIVRGEVVKDPSTIATAIRIGNPASWQYALSTRGTSRAASSTR